MHHASWEDSRCSEGERTMKAKGRDLLFIGTPDHLINIFHVRHTHSQFCVVRFNGTCNT